MTTIRGFRLRSNRSALTLALGLLAGLGVWCWRQIRLLGDVRGVLAAFYGWFALAFLAYLTALWLVRRMEREGAPARQRALWLGMILLTAIACRLAVLGATPTLSDDIYRYRWDGRVQLAGIDPYRYAPDDPALAALRDGEFGRINFPHLRTIYPPLTELAFRLGASLGGTLTAHKTVFVCAEAVTVLSLLFILRRRGRSLLWIAAYAWHPLAILEIAGSGHNDALGVAMLWLGLAAWEARRMGGTALAWTGAFLSKFLSVILAPWWWYRRQGRRWLAAFLGLSALLLAFHWGVVQALLESLSAMAARGVSNGSVYPLVVQFIGSWRVAPLVVIGCWAGFLVWWAAREADPVRYLFGAFAVAALLAPALHPWYLLWLIPCFCFWRVPAFLALTGTVVLCYTVWPKYLAVRAWELPVWARLLEYGPVLIFGMWEVRRCGWRSSFRPVTKPSLLAKS